MFAGNYSQSSGRGQKAKRPSRAGQGEFSTQIDPDGPAQRIFSSSCPGQAPEHLRNKVFRIQIGTSYWKVYIICLHIRKSLVFIAKIQLNVLFKIVDIFREITCKIEAKVCSLCGKGEMFEGQVLPRKTTKIEPIGPKLRWTIHHGQVFKKCWKSE